MPEELGLQLVDLVLLGLELEVRNEGKLRRIARETNI